MNHREPDGLPIAVALRYDGTGAPRVTAKGRGELAERILAVAREHGVLLHDEPALAAVLARIPLGDEIPEALYRAVAEVIAFAYLVSGRVPADPRRPAVPEPSPRDGTPPLSSQAAPRLPDSNPGN